ncbi:MAG: Trm112 family protein [Thalassobaculaceae bacterium]
MPATDPSGPSGNAARPQSGAADHAGVDPKLLEILVCPVTKDTLSYDHDAQELVSEKAGLAFPIRGGVPIMLVEEARRLDGTADAPLAAESGDTDSGT